MRMETHTTSSMAIRPSRMNYFTSSSLSYCVPEMCVIQSDSNQATRVFEQMPVILSSYSGCISVALFAELLVVSSEPAQLKVIPRELSLRCTAPIPTAAAERHHHRLPSDIHILEELFHTHQTVLSGTKIFEHQLYSFSKEWPTSTQHSIAKCLIEDDEYFA